LKGKFKALSVGVAITAIVAIVAVAYYSTQNDGTRTTFKVLPIEKPVYDPSEEKPSAYINISVVNTGSVNQTAVVIKVSGGYANSTNQVPQNLFWIVTRTYAVIKPGESITIKTFAFGWASYYEIEVSSAEVVKEAFSRWVSWRSWDVPVPT